MKIRLLLPLLLLISNQVHGQEVPDSVYVNISPDFVTNYDEGARLKYLKASVALKIVGLSEEAVRHHLPSIKNSLVILFTSQAEENLTSTVGRETLRREALDEVRRIMSTLERDGDQQIEDLYFTNFIVQQ
ncbi:MAG: flagellar basal body-associated protein FliL [Pseudomonadales bacterium]|nr:flagellar basal body-associated protein FliL [Pseudomonadales bacterium]